MTKLPVNIELLLDNKSDLSTSEAARILAIYQANPTLAAKDILQLKHGLPWYQRLALKVAWHCPNNIFIWSRGCGKTYFNAAFSLLKFILYPNERIGVFSASFRQAKYVFAEIEKMYNNSPIVREFCMKKPTYAPDRCYLLGRNDSHLEALPLGDGSTLRGARYYNIVADEAAQIPEEVFDVVIRGMTATTKDPMEESVRLKAQAELLEAGLITPADLQDTASNKILMSSTAFYRFNHLWQRVCQFENEIKTRSDLNPKILIDNGLDGTRVMWNNERSLLMFDYQDPPPGFMNMASIREAKLKMSDAKFRMEYACLFPSDSEGFFRRSKLERARDQDKFTVELTGASDANYVMGIDVARKSDNFAIAIGKIVQDGLSLVNIITLNNKSFNVMYDTIREVLKDFNIIHICMDTGGGGTTLQDMLENDKVLVPIIDSINDPDKRDFIGHHILDMVKFSDDSIPVMANQMLALLDNGRLSIAADPSRVIRMADGESRLESEKKGKIIGELEEKYAEIDHFIEETTSIVATATRTGKIHLGLPGELGADNKKDFMEGLRAPRKDRWTAGMLCCWAYHRFLNKDKFMKMAEPESGFALRL